jgi:ribosome-associated protein
LEVSTRVTLWFDLANSPSLSGEDKQLIADRLGKDVALRVASQETRGQDANRELAIERFVELMRAVLAPVPIRRKTRLGKEAKLRRLEAKRQRSSLKHERSRTSIED